MNNKCREIEILQKFAPQTMYKNVEEILGRKSNSPNGCLKDKDGNIIMEKDKILDRWSEYIHELFDDSRKEIDTMIGNIAGPPILKDEGPCCNHKDKNGKSNRPRHLS